MEDKHVHDMRLSETGPVLKEPAVRLGETGPVLKEPGVRLTEIGLRSSVGVELKKVVCNEPGCGGVEMNTRINLLQ